MCVHWNNKDVSHKGWILVDVIDIREGEPIKHNFSIIVRGINYSLHYFCNLNG
jgi:hypothetical protein